MKIREEYPLLFTGEQEVDKRYEEAWKEIGKLAGVLREKYKAEKVIVFGSLIDKERFHKYSDIDLAVKGIPDDKFYKAYGEITGLSNDFHVDLVDINDCKESLFEVIKKEGIPV